MENKTPLTKDGVQKLIVRLKNMKFTEVKMWIIANIVLSTGIRSRNMMEVKASDLDLENRTLYLCDTKSHDLKQCILVRILLKY